MFLSNSHSGDKFYPELSALFIQTWSAVLLDTGEIDAGQVLDDLEIYKEIFT